VRPARAASVVVRTTFGCIRCDKPISGGGPAEGGVPELWPELFCWECQGIAQADGRARAMVIASTFGAFRAVSDDDRADDCRDSQFADQAELHEHAYEGYEREYP
jgi:hypothetical protein